MSSLSGEAESHRIYWQQWLSTTSSTSTNGPTTTTTIPSPSSSPPSSPHRRNRRRQLTTSSAAVRIARHVAKAKDVTSLLRKTLNLANIGSIGETAVVSDFQQDSLVLVGTLQVPKNYVLFEHEQSVVSTPFPYGSSLTQDQPVVTTTGFCPFHLVKTLHPDDDPLMVRDEMMKHLRDKQNGWRDQQYEHHSSLDNDDHTPPTIQWFFVPGLGAPSIIPQCVELDGYSTTMKDGDYTDDDEEDDDDDDNDEVNYKVDFGESTDNAGTNRTDQEDTMERDRPFPFFSEGLVRPSLLESSLLFSSSSQQNGTATTLTRNQKQLAREWRRYIQISQSHNANPTCLVGYLLKQSSKDRHVWRMVYCVLTEDYMWYVHRIKPWWDQPTEGEHVNSSPMLEETIAMAPKHGKISLSEALLLEPNEDFERSPLHRVPHAFQIVDGKGVTHSFRAPSRSLSRQWINSISTRLMDCYENSFLENAELIIAEETMARNQRYKKVAVDRLSSKLSAWAKGSRVSSYGSLTSQQEELQPSEPPKEEEKQEWSHRSQSEFDLYTCHSSAPDNNIGDKYGGSSSTFRAQVLRLGMDIAQYREGCRHCQAVLLTQVGTESDRDENELSIPPVSSIALRTMVQHSWHVASELLEQARQIVSLVKVKSGHGTTSKKHSSRSLDTLCHHVEFVITGQIRRPSAIGDSQSNAAMITTTSSSTNGRADAARPSPCRYPDDPPPMDLLDRLLIELQHATAS